MDITLNSYMELFSIAIKKSWADTVIDAIDVGNFPKSLLFYPSNGNIYAGNYGSNDVSVIDSSTNAVIDSIPVGYSPTALEYNPSNGNIYVANIESEDVSVISAKPPIDEKPVADAGPNQATQSDDEVQLDGGKSYDPNGSSLIY